MARNYEWMMYHKILAHISCTEELGYNKPGDEEFCEVGSAIEIVSHHDGENVAIKCNECNEVIIDFDRPEEVLNDS